ncbi:DNA-binding HxlR family transcriptional regulator [Hymenobacter sp. 9A]|uniref:DNA-binding HxlR family transcriptional regulator n=1 Tax=Hymenobacter caeli TaxID=2735894 RepID=A0ABX2FVW7_9BACT|nr:DNA-binding HxlR family transcriptional regulator [Hymenobacter caeli]
MKEVYTCAISASVGTVGGKWKTSILLHLRDRTLRFGALQRSVNISQKVLTQQLKELEKDGLVRREVFAEVPPRVEYSLSAYGQTLQPVLDALYLWGRAHYIKSQAQAAAPAGPADSPLAEAKPVLSESEALLS